MQRFAKLFGVIAMVALGVHSAMGFALVGPPASWQITALGYSGRLSEIIYPPTDEWDWFDTPDWPSVPQNIGEGYRLSIPIVYYTYDPSFVEYFGSNGIAAIDSTMAILNNVFSTNMSKYSTELTEVPLSTSRINYTAAALQLFDLKSATLEMLMPRLGLADPEHWVWAAHDRFLLPGLSCPFYDFTVIQRNWDIVNSTPSAYVNGNLYTYYFLLFCPPGIDLTEPFPQLVDPLDNYETAIATPKITAPDIKHYGWFYDGLTRDDVAGLRYLYSTNNVQVEQAPPDTLLFVTNNSAGVQLQFTSNLTEFAEQAFTNSPAALEALFPGLIVSSSTTSYVNVFTTNVTITFTNAPYDPAGYPPTHPVYATNVTEAVIPWYHHIFANLETIIFTNGMWEAVPITDITLLSNYTAVTVQTSTVSITSPTYDPAGLFTFVTNTTSRVEAVKQVTGDYFILPTNGCGLDVIQLQASFVSTLTNILASGTNTTTATNVLGTSVPLSVSAVQLENVTNQAFLVYPILCATSSIALRQGFDKIQFVRHDYDSLLNRFFTPVTNFYTRVAITNNSYYTEAYMRVVTRPDILFLAADIPIAGNQVETIDHGQGTLSFNTTASIAGLNGPGTIEGPTTITFNNVGPVRLNEGPSFVDQALSIFFFNWGSFDGSTNPPVVYGGNTVSALNQLITMAISPSAISPGSVGSAYSANLSVTGGTPPYTWALGSGSPALPQGLTIGISANSPDGSQASISGTPAAGSAGQYNLWVEATDAGGRSLNKAYVLPITP